MLSPGFNPSPYIPQRSAGRKSRNSVIPNLAQTPTAISIPEHQWSIPPALLPVSSGRSTFSAGLRFPPPLLTLLVSQRAPEHRHAAARAESCMAGNGTCHPPCSHHFHPAPLSPTLTPHQHYIMDFAAVTSALHLDTVISPRLPLLSHARFQEPLTPEQERGRKISPSPIKHILC